MAETSVGPNNRLVTYRRKGTREMPSVSQSQSRFMHATAEGKTDAPPYVGKKFVKADHGRKIKRLPKHAKHFAKRGMISEKQMKKMKGEE
jgi:hypothetical protein